MSLAVTMMDSVGTLQRPRYSQDSKKGTVQTFFDVPNAVGVPCSVQPASASDKMLYGQRNVFVNATIYCLQDLGAQVGDEFLVNDINGLTHHFLVHGHNGSVFNRSLAPYTINVEEVAANRVPQQA